MWRPVERVGESAVLVSLFLSLTFSLLILGEETGILPQSPQLDMFTITSAPPIFSSNRMNLTNSSLIFQWLVKFQHLPLGWQTAKSFSTWPYSEIELLAFGNIIYLFMFWFSLFQGTLDYLNNPFIYPTRYMSTITILQKGNWNLEINWLVQGQRSAGGSTGNGTQIVVSKFKMTLLLLCLPILGIYESLICGLCMVCI